MDPKAVYGQQADMIRAKIGNEASMALAHYALLLKRCGVKSTRVHIVDPTL